MKNNSLLLFIIIISICLLCGCNSTNEQPKEESNDVVVDNQENLEISKQEDELTTKEKFAIEYISTFADAFKNPHSIKLYKVWVFEEYGYYYVAYNLSATNSYGAELEETYGNDTPIEYEKEDAKITVEYAHDMYSMGIGNYWNNTKNLKAIEKGELLDANKIQTEFEKNL